MDDLNFLYSPFYQNAIWKNSRAWKNIWDNSSFYKFPWENLSNKSLTAPLSYPNTSNYYEIYNTSNIVEKSIDSYLR